MIVNRIGLIDGITNAQGRWTAKGDQEHQNKGGNLSGEHCERVAQQKTLPLAKRIDVLFSG